MSLEEKWMSPGHLVESKVGTGMCSNVEINLLQTCLVSELVSFEYLFNLWMKTKKKKIWLSPITKAPTLPEMSGNQSPPTP